MLLNPYRFGVAGTRVLDFYSPRAAGALILMSSTWSDPLISIRRQSDAAVKSFYGDPADNYKLTLNSEDGSGTSLGTWIGAGNGFVSQLWDQTGNGRHFTQSTTTKQPPIVQLGVLVVTGDPVPAIVFSGSFYLAYQEAGVETITDASIFCISTRTVGNPNNDVRRPAGFVEDPSDASTKVTFAPAADATVRFDGATTGVGTGTFPTSNTAFIRSTFKTNTQIDDYIAESLSLSTSVSVNTSANTMVIGAAVVGFTTTFSDKVSAVLFFDTNELTNRADIESYLISDWL